MDDLLPEIRQEYERWISRIDNDPYAQCGKCLGIFDVLKSHFLVVNYFAVEEGEGIGGIGPKSLHLLHSALSRQMVGYGGLNKWRNDLEICATLFYGLIKDHPFHDANKRTAFLSLVFHLWRLGRWPDSSQKDFETLALRIASGTLDQYKGYAKYAKRYVRHDAEVMFIARFLSTHTRVINKRAYVVTYRQLDSILRRFGYGLENPQKNYIYVVRVQRSKSLFGRKQKMTSHTIMRIAFPSWGKEVAKHIVRDVRRVTGLTPENGYDSETFFHDVDPLPALISRFHPLLKRLADK